MGSCKRVRQYNPVLRRETVENDYYCALRQGRVNVFRYVYGKMSCYVGLSSCYPVLDVIQAAGFDFSDRSFDYRFMWLSEGGFPFPALLKVTFREHKRTRELVSEEFIEARLLGLYEGLNYE